MNKLDTLLEKYKIDRTGLYIGAGFFLFLVAMAVWYLSKGDSDTNEGAVVVNSSLEVPQDEEIDNYQTKLDAYAVENGERENKQSLDFDESGVFGNDSIGGRITKRRALEMKVDSMLNFSKRDSDPSQQDQANGDNVSASRSYQGTSYVRRSSTPSSTDQKLEAIDQSQKLQDAKLEMDDFFAVKSTDFYQKQADAINKERMNVISMDGTTDEMIDATIKYNQVIRNGNRITMMLSEDATINGKEYKRNTILYGITKFESNNRVLAYITKINHNNVNLEIYDGQDGLKGIYIEGQNLLGETVNESSQEVLNDVNVGGLPVGEALKGVLKKKQKEVTVQLLNDYRIIIKAATR